MLETVLQYGTAHDAAIGQFAAGKTGTTSNYGDAWFIGWEKVHGRRLGGLSQQARPDDHRVRRRARARRHLPGPHLAQLRGLRHAAGKGPKPNRRRSQGTSAPTARPAVGQADLDRPKCHRGSTGTQPPPADAGGQVEQRPRLRAPAGARRAARRGARTPNTPPRRLRPRPPPQPPASVRPHLRALSPTGGVSPGRLRPLAARGRGRETLRSPATQKRHGSSIAPG